MTRLSVNINKWATIRNARGGNNPDLIKSAIACERFGAHGITVHPRPDERHIRYADVRDLKNTVTTEFNIEGNPKEQSFVDLVLEVCPTQVTLVPDASNQLTSDHGWDTIQHQSYLKDIISIFKSKGIRCSIFVDPDLKMIEAAVKTGTHRIELYTETYAQRFSINPIDAVRPFVDAAKLAHDIGLQINAGHDLNLQNLNYFLEQVKFVDEVSIGHALICDALEFGLEKTINLYLKEIKP